MGGKTWGDLFVLRQKLREQRGAAEKSGKSGGESHGGVGR
jgi:hypothetical protein